VRRTRFRILTIGYPFDRTAWIRTLFLNSSNAARILTEFAWTKRNLVDVQRISYYVEGLRYKDSVEFVKLFLNPTSTNCLIFNSLDLNINSEFVRNAPPSYLYDLACFINSVGSVFCLYSAGDLNTLRFLSNSALESIKMLHVKLSKPLNANSDYVSETVNDIAKCINCTRLFFVRSCSLSSSLIRKLTMQLTRIVLNGCDLLTDNDFAWFLKSNKATLTHCHISGATCATPSTWKALCLCTEMIEIYFRISIENRFLLPFASILKASKALPKLKTLRVESWISDASKSELLELMLTYSRGGALNYVNINRCIGIDKYRFIKSRLENAYKSTRASIQVKLNDEEMIWTNQELSTYDALEIYGE